MTALTDTLITWSILIGLALLIYSRFKQQTVADTIRDIKEAVTNSDE